MYFVPRKVPIILIASLAFLSRIVSESVRNARHRKRKVVWHDDYVLGALLKQSVRCPAGHHDLSQCVPARVRTRCEPCISEKFVGLNQVRKNRKCTHHVHTRRVKLDT